MRRLFKGSANSGGGTYLSKFGMSRIEQKFIKYFLFDWVILHLHITSYLTE